MFRRKRSPDTIMVRGERIFARAAFSFIFSDASPYADKDQFDQPYFITAPSGSDPMITFYNTEEDYKIFLDLDRRNLYSILHISYKNCQDQGLFFTDSRKVHKEHTRLLYLAWGDSVRNAYV